MISICNLYTLCGGRGVKDVLHPFTSGDVACLEFRVQMINVLNVFSTKCMCRRCKKMSILLFEIVVLLEQPSERAPKFRGNIFFPFLMA